MDSAIASGIPRTSKLGIRLVNKEPGPIVIRSALAIAAKVCGSGSTSGGISASSQIMPLLAVMLVSPRTRVPSSKDASSSTLDMVAG